MVEEPQENPLYMDLLHANFLRFGTASAVLPRLYESAAGATDAQLSRGLQSGWRESLHAAWCIGVTKDQTHFGAVRRRLLESSSCFQGQGYCFAMARFENQAAADALSKYLETYLPVGDREYDQIWAIGALAWIDKVMGTHRADPFLDERLWDIQLVGPTRNIVIGCLEPQRGIKLVEDIMSALNEHERANIH